MDFELLKCGGVCVKFLAAISLEIEGRLTGLPNPALDLQRMLLSAMFWIMLFWFALTFFVGVLKGNTIRGNETRNSERKIAF